MLKNVSKRGEILVWFGEGGREGGRNMFSLKRGEKPQGGGKGELELIRIRVNSGTIP